MSRRTNGWYLMIAVLLGLWSAPLATAKKPEVSLAAGSEQLLTTYTGMLDSLRAEITASAPAIDEQKKSIFLAAHAAVAKVPAPPNPSNLKLAPPRYADSNPDYKDAQEGALVAARALLPDVDSFLGSDKLHAQLVKCALLADATPRGLAEFAQQGKEHEALITGRVEETPSSSRSGLPTRV